MYCTVQLSIQLTMLYSSEDIFDFSFPSLPPAKEAHPNGRDSSCPYKKELVDMINAASLSVVNNARFSQRFVRPCYDSYCFSNIPPTIEFLLTGKGQSALPLPAFRNL